MISYWALFRDFVNSKEVGHTFNRIDFIKFGESKNFGMGTVDGFRSLTCKGKFLSKVSRGQYRLDAHMPEGLTMGALYALLRGDNLTYFESIQKQKDFKIVKDKFLKERNEVLTHLVNEVSKFIPYAEPIENSAFGLKQLVRGWTWALEKEPSPTREWKKRNQAPC